MTCLTACLADHRKSPRTTTGCCSGRRQPPNAEDDDRQLIPQIVTGTRLAIRLAARNFSQESEMALRVFVDADGTEWQAWDVPPSRDYAQVRCGFDRRVQASPGIHPE